MKYYTTRIPIIGLLLAFTVVLGTSCSTSSKTQKGAAIGAGAGATVGALIGKTAGNAALGTIIGGAIGGTAGAYIGKKMDQVRGLDQTILFDTGSSELSPVAQTNLKNLSVNLKSDLQTNVSIIGHTDSLGTPEYNMDLSVKRAEAVRSFLVGAGVSNTRLTMQGKGTAEPIASNTTHEGRQKNRRVEIVVTVIKKQSAPN